MSEPIGADDDRNIDRDVEVAEGHAPSDYARAEPATPASCGLRREQVIVNDTIAREIIPRLLLAHRNVPNATRSQDARPTDADVDAFAALLLASDEDAAGRFLQRVMARGVALDALLLELVAPTARRLGEMWEIDLCTFIDVTLGVYRLQKLLADLSRAIDADGLVPAHRGSVLLVPAPGEQHTFGLLVVEEFLRKAGFDVWTHLASDGDSTMDLLARTPFDVIGISIARLESVAATRKFLAQARKVSLNAALFVMAGGAAIASGDVTAEMLGCDAVSVDGKDAEEHIAANLAPPTQPRQFDAYASLVHVAAH